MIDKLFDKLGTAIGYLLGIAICGTIGYFMLYEWVLIIYEFFQIGIMEWLGFFGHLIFWSIIVIIFGTLGWLCIFMLYALYEKWKYRDE